MAQLTKETVEPGKTARESSSQSSQPSSASVKPTSGNSRPDAVSLEVAVKIHGSRVTTAIPTQTEPFEEQTTTMIVFPQGCVVRMTAAVNVGQMLVLTNLKSRQDAICRVVKVRSFANAQSYVEVEFTHSQAGYWGVYFSSEGGASKRPVTPAVRSGASQMPTSGSSTSPVGQNRPAATRVEPGGPPKPAAPVKSSVTTAGPSQPKPVSPFAPLGSQEKIQPAASSTSEAQSAHPRPTEKITYGGQLAKDDVALNLSSAVKSAEELDPLAGFGSNRGESSASVTTADSVLAGLGSDDTAADEAVQMESLRAELARAHITSPPAAGGQNWALIAACVALLLVAVGGGVWYFHSKAGESQAAPVPVASSSPSPSSPAATENAANQPNVPRPIESSVSSTKPAEPADVNVKSRANPAATNQEVASHSAAKGADSASSVADEVETKQPAPKSVLNAKMKAHPLSTSRSVDPRAQAPALDAAAMSTAQPGDLSGITSPSVAVPPPPPSAEGINPGTEAKEPKVVSSVLPIYPSTAKQARVEGDVIIDAQIDAKGNVARMQVVSGPTVLRQAAVDALRRWKYEPTHLDGELVHVLVRMKFRL